MPSAAPILACLAVCLTGPTAFGWDHVYDAASGLLPSQYGWSNGGYSSATAAIGNDSLTGEPTLQLDHTASTSAAQYAAWDMLTGDGVGTGDDFFTLDLRFRLLDSTSADQLALAVIRPANEAVAAQGFNEQRYVLRFNTAGVRFARTSGFDDYAAPLGQQWHDARLAIDLAHQTAQLFLDGSTTPLFVDVGAGGLLERNFIRFGDGSATVSGRAQVSRLRWTNNAMIIPLEGGEAHFLHRELLAENDEHINFPFAQRFNDGTIWLTHSIGTHVVNERTVRRWSLDNGQHWTEPAIASISPINSYQLDDGEIIALTAWDQNYTTTHNVFVHRWPNPTTNKTQRTASVELPWSSQLFLHRTMIEAGDGSLIQTAYARMEDQHRFRAFTLRSTDGGNSWVYGGTIGFDPESPFDTGFSEPAIVRLADDTLLALMRTGSPVNVGPLMQSKSTDHGLTWSDPVPIAEFGVDPHVIRLSNGALVASSGRPGVYLLVDFSGTGDHWQEIPVYDGVGSSYTSLLEVEPNLVMLLYDESGFGGADLSIDVPNRLYAIYVRIVPEPTAAAAMLVALCVRRRSRCGA